MRALNRIQIGNNGLYVGIGYLVRDFFLHSDDRLAPFRRSLVLSQRTADTMA